MRTLSQFINNVNPTGSVDLEATGSPYVDDYLRVGQSLSHGEFTEIILYVSNEGNPWEARHWMEPSRTGYTHLVEIAGAYMKAGSRVAMEFVIYPQTGHHEVCSVITLTAYPSKILMMEYRSSSLPSGSRALDGYRNYHQKLRAISQDNSWWLRLGEFPGDMGDSLEDTSVFL
jgi:hypothetical protein